MSDNEKNEPHLMPSACTVCGAAQFETVYRKIDDYEFRVNHRNPKVIRCTHCGLISLFPVPSRRELSVYYPPGYTDLRVEDKHIHRMAVERIFKRRCARLSQWIPAKADVLDVGCSAGHFIGYLADHKPDWTVTGVEMDSRAARLGLARGRNIVDGRFEDVIFQRESFDLIMLPRVLETITSPSEMLIEAHAYLKPDGKLYIETPNAASLDARLFGRYWGGLHYPRHTHIFSRTNIQTLLVLHGFKLIEQGSLRDSFGWALSIQNWITDQHHMTIRHGRIRIYPILAALFAPILISQTMLQNSCSMYVIASKQQ